jgi:hypothetical protein
MSMPRPVDGALMFGEVNKKYESKLSFIKIILDGRGSGPSIARPNIDSRSM